MFHLKYFVLISENLKCEGCIKCQSLLRQIKFQTKIKTLTIQIDKVANDSGNNESLCISLNAFWMVCDWTVIYLLSTRWACRQLFCNTCIKLDIFFRFKYPEMHAKQTRIDVKVWIFGRFFILDFLLKLMLMQFMKQE